MAPLVELAQFLCGSDEKVPNRLRSNAERSDHFRTSRVRFLRKRLMRFPEKPAHLDRDQRLIGKVCAIYVWRGVKGARS